MLLLTLLNGCLTLDPLLPFHSNIPCSQVDESTCEGEDGEQDEWDRICTTCEEEYDWDRVAPWREQTFETDETIPSIDPSIVEQITIEIEDGVSHIREFAGGAQQEACRFEKVAQRAEPSAI